MRTVILNTLGSELRQTSLFYLPFREEQFQWIDAALPHIGDAVEKISVNSSHQGQIQDYHLVVLVSLSRYHLCRHKRLREVCQQLVQAHINHALVLPLVTEQNLSPKAVSIVCVTHNCVDGDGGVTAGKELDALLGFTDQEEITSLVLTADDGEQLDMTCYFQAALQDYACKREGERQTSVNTTENRSLRFMRSDLKDLLKSLCECRYFAPGEDRVRTVDVRLVDFFPKTTNLELFSIDLQINLTDHLTDAVNGVDKELSLQSHDEKEIQQRISLALHRVRRQRNSMDDLTYYPMEPLTDTLDADTLPAAIWEKLRVCAALSDMDDFKEIISGHVTFGDSEESKPEGNAVVTKLSTAWLRLGKAKNAFEKQCRTFAEQYNPDTAKEQQMIVLDTCAGIFRDWRVRMLRRSAEELDKPTLSEMPVYDLRTARVELERAQQAYGEVCVERLEDYEDLRKEAEVVKANFRQDTRLWPTESASSTWWFLLYSGVLAVLFLLQMILPFVGITVKTASAQMSGYIHMGISILVFATLYVVGVILWMRALCARVNRHTRDLHTLIQRSRERRRQSILDAVDTYGTRLPACMIKYENLKRLERIYAANQLRKNHYHTHVQILDKAEELLMEMHTRLRLPVNTNVEDANPVKKIDYQCAPSDAVNVHCYIFLSEKWGGG